MQLSQSACFQSLDSFVERIHRTGFVQSFIIHVTALLVMGLILVLPDDKQSAPLLTLAFDADPEEPLILDETPLPDLFMPPSSPEAADDDIVQEPVAVEVAPALLDMATEPLVMPDLSSLMMEIPTASLDRGERFMRVSQAAYHEMPGGAGGGNAIGGELGRRLTAAGAMTGDVQVSIAWDDVNDIDVHVMVEPLFPGPSSLIDWTRRVGICGGMLDVDANASPHMMTNHPVENIFWRKGAAPSGRYTIAVHHFNNWSGAGQSRVEVAVLVDGKVERFHPVVTFGEGPKVVTTFVRQSPTQPPLAVSRATDSSMLP